MEKTIVVLLSFVLLFSLFSINTEKVFACSYIAQTPAEKFAGADVVFLGKVTAHDTVSHNTKPLDSGTETTVDTVFTVSKYWKGKVGVTAQVFSPYTVGTSCEPFRGQMDTEYVVYADMDTAGNLTTTEVGPVVVAYANADLELLGEGKTLEMDLDKYMVKYFFTKNLSLGMKGSEVLSLQKYLNSRGYKVAIVGPGSPGSETSYFGPATKSALIKFQIAKSITPAVGFFGPITRGIVNAN